jgi:hypothetical protein
MQIKNIQKNAQYWKVVVEDIRGLEYTGIIQFLPKEKFNQLFALQQGDI